MTLRWGHGLGAVAMVGVLALAACGTGDQGTPQAGGNAATGGSLTWAVETQPLTFNPHLWSQNKARLLVHNQFDSLISRNGAGEFLPWLAKSWEVSKDGLTYTLHLRDDVTFHDGEKFNAAAVKANFDQLLKDGYAPAVAAISLGKYKGLEVVDDYTVKITLKSRDGLFLDFLSSPQAGQVSPKSLTTAKDLKAGGPDLVGTGPFILDRFVPGQEVHYKRNPAYAWGPGGAAHQGPAYLNEITYRFLPEAAVRIGALTSGQVQVIEGIPATELGPLKQDPSLKVQTSLNSGSAYSYYFNTSHAPFDDKRVREAFRDAVDVDTILTSVYQGTAKRAWSVVSAASQFYDPSLEGSYGNKVAEANTLLDAAGWTTRDSQGYRTKDGKRLTVREVASAPYVRDRRDILAQALQAAVKQSAGIDFQYKLADAGTADKARLADDFELFGNSRGDGDAGVALNLILGKGGVINVTHYDNPDVDTWLKQASDSSDPAERKDLYAKVQKQAVGDDAVVFPIYVPADQIASETKVSGIGFEPVSGTPNSAYDVRIGT